MKLEKCRNGNDFHFKRFFTDLTAREKIIICFAAFVFFLHSTFFAIENEDFIGFEKFLLSFACQKKEKRKNHGYLFSFHRNR
jgi:hypothetical protein